MPICLSPLPCSGSSNLPKLASAGAIQNGSGTSRIMIRDVPEPFWMAPALASFGKFEEPLQGSGLKQMGILKPWAATRSYGLVVRCDSDMQPMFSYHSRADGTIHGVTSVCEDRADLLVAAKGPGVLVRLSGAAERPSGARPT